MLVSQKILTVSTLILSRAATQLIGPQYDRSNAPIALFLARIGDVRCCECDALREQLLDIKLGPRYSLAQALLPSETETEKFGASIGTPAAPLEICVSEHMV